jgi:hypothetical protein
MDPVHARMDIIEKAKIAMVHIVPHIRMYVTLQTMFE